MNDSGESRSRWPQGLFLATALFLALLGSFANRWVAADHADEVPISVEVNRPPEEVGRWLDPMSWPLVGGHAAVLRKSCTTIRSSALARQPRSGTR